MKEFLQLMRRFVSPYKKYIGWAVLLNILSAVFNVFSFTFLIPILSILFKTEGADKVYHFIRSFCFKQKERIKYTSLWNGAVVI